MADKQTRRAAAESAELSPRHRGTSGNWSRRTGWFVALVPFFVAIPFGLNRPIFWLSFGIVVSAWALVHFANAHRGNGRSGRLREADAWLLGLAALVPLWAVLQAVPLPLTGTNSILPAASATGALRVGIYILFFTLACLAGGRASRMRRLLLILCVGVVAHAAWGLVALNLLGDVAVWGEKTAYLGFATGTFINRNSFATFLSIGICLGSSLVFTHTNNGLTDVSNPNIGLERGLSRALIALGLVILWLALFATQSRLGVAGALIGTVTAICLVRTGAGRVSRATIARTLVIALVVLAVAGLAAGAGLIDRIIELRQSAEHRLVAYGFAMELIADRPLTGHGFDTFRLAFEAVHRPPLPGNFYWDRAHSTYLSHWVELGVIIGSIPVVLGLVVCVRLVRRIYTTGANVALPSAALAAMVATGIQSVADFGLEIPANTILLLAVVGLALGARSDTKRHPG